ncbi:histidine phosphatase family protein [Paraglaciecola hydrolytica]|uniref:Histidine phosphatase n=1 Tax=Paraglaciecola hydrolytica TaxID=1799789 RepID=A0A148KNF9_9ALTE|nr:histidine phosphatase family protein [Paraglaciecola hydrolytica]KXI27789.1 histidine phosphatase [Paraglaciecola hydrolytica]
MSELFLVRHGQASFGAKNYDKLSPLGLQQSVWLGEYFKQRNISFAQLWRGDLQRQQETAQGIVSQLSEPIVHSANVALNEFDFQVVARAYLNLYPQDALAANAAPSDFLRLLKKAMLAWSQGVLATENLIESWDSFRQRVVDCLSLITQQQLSKPILVVSSGGVIAMMMGIVLGLDARQIIELNLQIRNSSLSHFHFNQHSIRLSSFNNITHLDTPERLSSITFS